MIDKSESVDCEKNSKINYDVLKENGVIDIV